MHGLHFISAGDIGVLAYQGQYDTGLVMVSVLLAVLASYAAMSQLEIIRRQQTLAGRLGWYLLGAVTLGMGVWSMHFVGMLAHRLPFPVLYDIGLTAFSLLPAMMAGLVTLHLIIRPQPHPGQVIVAGVLLGAGIGLMHYVGMAAMRMEAMMYYRPVLFMLSVAEAVMLAVLALSAPYLLSRYIRHPHLMRLIVAVLMGLAVSGMHYTAMRAAVFLPGLEPLSSHGTFSEGPLAEITIAASVFIIVVALLSTLLVERLDVLHSAILHSQREQERLNKQLQHIAERVPGMVYQIERTDDERLRIPYANDAIRRLFGLSPEQVRNDAGVLFRLVHPEDLPGFMDSIRQATDAREPWIATFRACLADGSVRWLMGNAMPESDSQRALWNGFIMDITDQKKAEEEIHRLANYDPLTGLPNRRFLSALLDQALKESRSTGQWLMVIGLELDDLQFIGATEGAVVAERLLRSLGHCLETHSRHGDVLARTGNHQFTLLWTALGNDEDQARRQSEQRLLLLRGELLAQHPEHLKSIRAGLVLARDGSADDLLAYTGLALSYASRAEGLMAYYDTQAQQAMRLRRQQEEEIQRALEQGEFELFLQPQFDISGQQCLGAEALVRWRHPLKGLTGPDQFIPLAEEMGLIVRLGNIVLRQACGILQRWQQQPVLQQFSLSVNVSAAQFRRDDFIPTVLQCLQEFGIPAQRLKLEITESMAMENMQQTIDTIQALQQHGIRFSMDDFGTGYSSLSYFSRLPFDEIKVDKSFIQAEMNEQGQRDWMIVEGVIAMATRMGKITVAEGVETAEQHQRLKERGCPAVQGYLFGRPMPQAEFERLWQVLP